MISVGYKSGVSLVDLLLLPYSQLRTFSQGLRASSRADCLDVLTLKIIRNFFDFYIFMNQNKCRLHKTWSDRLNKVVHYNYSIKLICYFVL